MSQTKKECAIIFIVNRNYLFALATMLINLREIDFSHEIVIYFDDLSDHEKDDLLKINSNLNFVRYTLQDWVNEHKAIESPMAQSFLNKYSHLAWSKYKVFEQLAFYKKILLLDLDMLIMQNLSDLYQIDNGIAWRNGQDFHGKFGDKKALLEHISPIPKNYPSPNGGLLYGTDTIDYKKFCADARDFTIKFLDYFASGLDELAIAWAVSVNQIPLIELDETEYNTLPELYHYGHSKIIHFMSTEKLWNNETLQICFPEWVDYYQKATKIINISSDKIKLHYPRAGKAIKRKMNESRWLNFLRYGNITIPDNLKLNYDLANEWLVLRFQNNIYYEFKFSSFRQGYLVGLWIRNKFYQNDKRIMQNIDQLVKNSSILYKMEDKRGVYIYTERVELDEVSNLFSYFFQETQKIFTA